MKFLSPLLVIGSLVKQFKKQYQGRIFYVESVNDCRDLIDRYSGIERLEYPLVIEDISSLSVRSQSVLLKFIENSTLNFVFLASFDNISFPFLSRMAQVKKGIFKRTYSKFNSLSSEDIPDNNIPMIYYGETSPIRYYYEDLLQGEKNRGKLISFLSELKAIDKKEI